PASLAAALGQGAKETKKCAHFVHFLRSSSRRSGQPLAVSSPSLPVGAQALPGGRAPCYTTRGAATTLILWRGVHRWDTPPAAPGCLVVSPVPAHGCRMTPLDRALKR